MKIYEFDMVDIHRTREVGIHGYLYQMIDPVAQD
jgi:hypothetical protein